MQTIVHINKQLDNGKESIWAEQDEQKWFVKSFLRADNEL